MTIKIEKGVPLPEGVKMAFPFDQMEIGDSFRVDEIKQSRISGRIQTYRNHPGNSGKRFIIRAEGDGFRVWRVK